MSYYLGKKTRSYRMEISVSVDNPDDPNTEPQMDALCSKILKSLETLVNNLDGGTKRLTVSVWRHD